MQEGRRIKEEKRVILKEGREDHRDVQMKGKENYVEWLVREGEA